MPEAVTSANQYFDIHIPNWHTAMSRTAMCFLAGISAILSAQQAWAEPDALSEPIFQTGVSDPTQDKPQSKLWFAHDRYWAWLPLPGGSAVLERTPAGWRELSHLRSVLVDLPGQADVWAEASLVRAVLVGQDRLAVVELTFDVAQDTYLHGTLRHQFTLPPLQRGSDPLETATIAHDSQGRWWIGCDRDQQIFVFWTTDADGRQWSSGCSLSTPVHRDDICALIALPDRVVVIWSDQISDTVFSREHIDRQPPNEWSRLITVQQGDKTADDHLNGVVAEDGTLFVATKNSVDQIAAPQQVLRVRRPDGRWENHPYAVLHEKLGPSRPIALLAGPSQQLYLLHTNYDKRDSNRRNDFIAAISSARDPLDLMGAEVRILSAARPVNNVTGPKRPFPAGIPWIVLASDAEGGVYEATLPTIGDR